MFQLPSFGKSSKKAEPLQSDPVYVARPIARVPTPERAIAEPMSPSQAFAASPRRIKRLRVLALEGASGRAQIENTKNVCGLWARAFCKLYDSRPELRRTLETLPFNEVFTKVNNLIDKKAL